MKNVSEIQVNHMNLKSAIPAFMGLNLCCLAILLFMVIEDYLALSSVLSFNEVSKMIIVIIFASIVLTLYGILLTYLTSAEHINETNKGYQNNSIFEIVSFMFVAALFEELLFRGIIQNVLFLTLEHQWLAIILTAFLFVAFHIQYYRKPWMLLNITVPSLVLGWSYFYTDNLLVPLFIHFVNNVGITILFKFNVIKLKS